jgi:hypothetical protein
MIYPGVKITSNPVLVERLFTLGPPKGCGNFDVIVNPITYDETGGARIHHAVVGTCRDSPCSRKGAHRRL